ncbi:MAG: nucleotide sugar dehydrogenase [Candidatus Woesearchaeota archaeon]
MDSRKVCIVGLGYVGLPLACLCAEKGYSTIGYDINSKIIEHLKDGITIIEDKILKNKIKNFSDKIVYSFDPKIIQSADIIIICVPTPIKTDYKPNLDPLISAVNTIKHNLKYGALVIIESTIYPGTSEEIVLPIFANLKCGKDYFLAHCPERIDPGNAEWDVSNIPRVIGGVTEQCADLAIDFYRSIISADILRLNSIKAVEATKVMENSFRDINIAFMNEMAKSFDKMGIDIMDVIRAASTKPFSFLPHYPGCGVGGHCIPVDPYYLIEKAKETGFEHKFLMLAREINNSMPLYTTELVVDALNELGLSVKDTKISILGLAYKPDVNDIRESPSFKIINFLRKKGANLLIYDPFIPDQSNVSTIYEALDCDCLVLVTSHSEFKDISPQLLKDKRVRAVIDGRNLFDKNDIIAHGIIYKGIGR